jgi:hypothetical protein
VTKPPIHDLTPVITALEQLNALVTADDVARELRRRNVTGAPFSPCHCPLAMYLQRFTDLPVHVGTQMASVRTPLKGDMRGSTVISIGGLTDATRRFIQFFDGGHYPELSEVTSWRATRLLS